MARCFPDLPAGYAQLHDVGMRHFGNDPEGAVDMHRLEITEQSRKSDGKKPPGGFRRKSF
jgi:hypothetical protein